MERFIHPVESPLQANGYCWSKYAGGEDCRMRMERVMARLSGPLHHPDGGLSPGRAAGLAVPVCLDPGTGGDGCRPRRLVLAARLAASAG